MGWIQCLLAVCLILQLADSKPHYAKRTDHIKKTIRPCVQVATAAGEILDFADMALHLQSGQFQEMVNTFSDFDIYDQSERERVLCRLEGLSTLSEFLEAAADLGLDYNVLKVAYDYFSASLRMDKYYTQQSIEQNYEWTNPRTNRLTMELIQNLEAFGFLGLDPPGEQAMIDIATEYWNPAFVVPDVEPPSTLPLDEQCAQLTNSMRKMWNSQIRETSKLNPSSSAGLRQVIQEWTGIEITDHDSVKLMVCDVMGRIDSDGLEGIYDWIVDMMIMNYGLKQVYPSIQGEFQHAQWSFQMMLGEGLSNYPGNYGDSSFSGGRRHKRTSPPMYYGNGNEVGGDNGGPYPAYGGPGYGGPGNGGPGYGGPGYGGPGYGGPGNGDPGYGGPGYGGPGYGGPGYGGPSPEEATQMYTNMAIILDNLELMGLISLTDDLRK